MASKQVEVPEPGRTQKVERFDVQLVEIEPRPSEHGYWVRYQDVAALLSQPEHQGDEGLRSALSILRLVETPAGATADEHDEAIQVLTRLAAQPPAQVLSEEGRDALSEIADRLVNTARKWGPDAAIEQAEEDAAFLRTLASQEHRGEEGRGRSATDAAWEESGRSALDEMFEALTPRDGSEGNLFEAAMLAPHAWAEIKRLRSQPPAGEVEGLREQLEAEIEERRGWAAEHRDLATQAVNAETGEAHLAQARRVDDNTDRLQLLLDAPPSDSQGDQERCKRCGGSKQIWEKLAGGGDHGPFPCPDCNPAPKTTTKEEPCPPSEPSSSPTPISKRSSPEAASPRRPETPRSTSSTTEGWPPALYAVRDESGNVWANTEDYEAVEEEGHETLRYLPATSPQHHYEQSEEALIDRATDPAPTQVEGDDERCGSVWRLIGRRCTLARGHAGKHRSQSAEWDRRSPGELADRLEGQMADCTCLEGTPSVVNYCPVHSDRQPEEDQRKRADHLAWLLKGERERTTKAEAERDENLNLANERGIQWQEDRERLQVQLERAATAFEEMVALFEQEAARNRPQMAAKLKGGGS